MANGWTFSSLLASDMMRRGVVHANRWQVVDFVGAVDFDGLAGGIEDDSQCPQRPRWVCNSVRILGHLVVDQVVEKCEKVFAGHFTIPVSMSPFSYGSSGSDAHAVATLRATGALHAGTLSPASLRLFGRKSFHIPQHEHDTKPGGSPGWSCADLGQLGLAVVLFRVRRPVGQVARNAALVGLDVFVNRTILPVRRLRRRIRLSFTAIRTSQV